MICDESLALRNRFPFLPIQPLPQQINAGYIVNANTHSYAIPIPPGAVLMRIASNSTAACFYDYKSDIPLGQRSDDFESNGTACVRIKKYNIITGSKRIKVGRLGTDWIACAGKKSIYVGAQTGNNVITVEFIIKTDRS